MGKVQLGGDATRPKPANSGRQPLRQPQRGVSLGTPKDSKHSSKGVKVGSGRTRYFLLALGAALCVLLVILVVTRSDGSCLNQVSISRYAKDGVIEAPVNLRPDLSTSHCIRRVSYLLDEVKVGEREFFPFDINLDAASLKSSNLGNKEKYKLAIVVEDEDGGIKEQPENVWVTFAGSEKAVEQSENTSSKPPEEKRGNLQGDRLNFLEKKSLVLTTQITRRADYVLGEKFLELVDSKVPDYTTTYKDAAGLIRKSWKQKINVAFNYFHPSVVGYVLALSRSGFDPTSERRGIGLWQIPPESLKSVGFTEADYKSSNTSPKVAADYTKELLNAFDNDYILMIAYYGVSIERAGSINGEVARRGLRYDERADVMKLAQLGVLNGEELDNVANFFAAGIVALSPTEFGIDAPPLTEFVR